MILRQRFIKNKGASPERERLNFFEVQTYRIRHVKYSLSYHYIDNVIIDFYVLNWIIAPLN